MRYSLNSYAIRQRSKSGTIIGISGDDVPRAETLWCDDTFADVKASWQSALASGFPTPKKPYVRLQNDANI